MKTAQPYFTIFSGTYNSSGVIHRLFKSVTHQTFQDFEWIIVDDLSKDNTVALIEDFLANHPHLNVQFIKHTANTGVAGSRWEALQKAKGKYFITWDHDDIQLEDQLETFNKIWEENDDPQVGAICSCLIDENGKRVGRQFPNDKVVSTYFGMYSKYIMGGSKPGSLNERHLCNNTEKFKEAIRYIQKEGIIVPPELPNGSEVWGMMAVLGYKTIYINKIVRQYFIEPDRPSMTTIGRAKGAKRIYRDRKIWINYFIDELPGEDWKIKLRTFLSFGMYGSYAGLSFSEMMGDIKSPVKKLVAAVFYLPGKILKNRLEKKSG